jgi:hypothetical protein
MKVTPLHIPDVLLIEPHVFEDSRLFFFERFRDQSNLKYAQLDEVVGNPKINLNNTLSFLKKEVGDSSFPNLNKILNDQKITKMYVALSKDAGS